MRITAILLIVLMACMLALSVSAMQKPINKEPIHTGSSIIGATTIKQPSVQNIAPANNAFVSIPSGTVRSGPNNSLKPIFTGRVIIAHRVELDIPTGTVSGGGVVKKFITSGGVIRAHRIINDKC